MEHPLTSNFFLERPADMVRLAAWIIVAGVLLVHFTRGGTLLDLPVLPIAAWWLGLQLTALVLACTAITDDEAA